MSTTKGTYTDLAALPVHQVGELIAGTLYTWPRPRPSHSLASGRTFTQLDTSADGRGGWHIRIEPELRLLHEHIVVPDLAGWRRGDVRCCPMTCRSTSFRRGSTKSRRPRRLGTIARSRCRSTRRPASGGCGCSIPDTRILEVFQAMPAGWLLVGSDPDDVRAPILPFEHVTFDLAALWR